MTGAPTMPQLSNPRHERFAQELAAGKSQDEAYAVAGYSSNRGNAARMKANESIAARVAELQAGAARITETTVAGLTEALFRIARDAEDLKEASGLSVARAALMDIAKLNGLVVERSESTTRHQRVSAELPTAEEWADKYVTEH